jgi:hypothetical protein
VLDKLGFKKKSLVERWAEHLVGAVEGASEGLERSTARATELAEKAGRRGESYVREAGKRARKARRRARVAGKRTRKAGEDLIEAGERLGERALSGAQVSRDALAERIESIAARAAELREERRRRRIETREQDRRRARREEPMVVDLRGKRIVLSGRRPVDLYLSDGGTVRYRYYHRPGFLRRFYLNLRGRRVRPR